MRLKFIFLFYSLVQSQICLAQWQSNFDRGFKVGFKNGYCYTSSNTSIYCTPPEPPAFIPLPKYPEKSENYQDGYNRGFIVGIQQRRNEEIQQNNSTYIPKFNPYIPQNPILYLTPQERAALLNAKATRDAELANAIGNLLEQLFTTSPERQLQKVQRKKEKDYKRMLEEIEKNEKKGSSKLIYGSTKYNNKIKEQKFWLTTSICSGTLAIVSYLIANKYANQYSTATTNASELRKNGNLAYELTDIFSVISGVTLIKFGINNIKIKKSKNDSQSIYKLKK
jgi:hypothetical protein